MIFIYIYNISGLWFGLEKPIPNLFLKAMESELKLLYNGITLTIPSIFSKKLIRALCICGTCDLPAKSLFLNFSQFNGEYGCPSCEQKTQRVNIEGSSYTVYRYENSVQRTLGKTLENAKKAVENREKARSVNIKTNVMGVKGPSRLSLLMPDYVIGIAIDSMHALYEGVAKKLMRLWFDSQFSTSPFSLRKVMAEIDSLFIAIKPPKFIHRLPGSIFKYHNWKASEFKNWLFYFSVPILKDFMRPDFFHHYLLFVSSISILNKSRICNTQLDQARYNLNKFVQQYTLENMYGLKNCSINVHNLTHLTDNVIALGPLWVHSCFTFEDLNGQLLKGIHGTSNIDSQIVKTHWRMLNFSSKVSNLVDDNNSDIFLSNKKQVKIIEFVEDDCYSVGTYKKFNETENIIAKIPMEYLPNSGFTLRCYYRLLKSNLLYLSEEYKVDLKCNSYFVKYEYKKSTCFGKILYFIKISHCNCKSDKCLCKGNHVAVVNQIMVNNPFVTGDTNHQLQIEHIYRGIISDNIAVIRVSELKTPCVVVYNNETLYLSTPVNAYELE